MCISNRQSTMGNSSQPGPSDDRRNSSQETKKFGTIATARHSRNQHVGPNGVRPWGERRSPLRDAQNLRATTTSQELVLQKRVAARRSQEFPFSFSGRPVTYTRPPRSARSSRVRASPVAIASGSPVFESRGAGAGVAGRANDTILDSSSLHKYLAHPDTGVICETWAFQATVIPAKSLP